MATPATHPLPSRRSHPKPLSDAAALLAYHEREAERREDWARQAEARGLTRRHRVLLTQAYQHRKWAALLRTLTESHHPRKTD